MRGLNELRGGGNGLDGNGGVVCLIDDVVELLLVKPRGTRFFDCRVGGARDFSQKSKFRKHFKISSKVYLYIRMEMTFYQVTRKIISELSRFSSKCKKQNGPFMPL